MVALCGGTGGAKLADGLQRVLPAGALTVVVNTADDFRHLGLTICPDVDTVLYTLAGIADPANGWGIAGDSPVVMEALRQRGGPDWFHLGDRDLATHLARTAWLDEGRTPTEITARLAAALGVASVVLPMSDDPVATVIRTDAGTRAFQPWFVRDRCRPPARGLDYAGAASARPAPGVAEAIAGATRVVVCPSNPYLSIGPILAVPGIRAALAAAAAPVVAVSPVIGGRAMKGPTAEMLRDLAGASSSAAVAGLYDTLVDVWVIDSADAAESDAVGAWGAAVLVSDTLMRDAGDRARLARAVLEAGARAATPPG